MRGFLVVQSVPIAIYEGLFGSAKCPQEVLAPDLCLRVVPLDWRGGSVACGWVGWFGFGQFGPTCLLPPPPPGLGGWVGGWVLLFLVFPVAETFFLKKIRWQALHST